MKITIVHDEKGKILGVIKPVDLKSAGSKFHHAGIQPSPGQRVVEIELDSELERLPVLDLHEHYAIEVAGSKLVRKSQAG